MPNELFDSVQETCHIKNLFSHDFHCKLFAIDFRNGASINRARTFAPSELFEIQITPAVRVSRIFPFSQYFCRSLPLDTSVTWHHHQSLLFSDVKIPPSIFSSIFKGCTVKYCRLLCSCCDDIWSVDVLKVISMRRRAPKTDRNRKALAKRHFSHFSVARVLIFAELLRLRDCQ